MRRGRRGRTDREGSPRHHHRATERGTVVTVAPRASIELSPLSDAPVHVAPWLLMGAAESAADLPLMRKLGVTHVLNVTRDVPHAHKPHLT